MRKTVYEYRAGFMIEKSVGCVKTPVMRFKVRKITHGVNFVTYQKCPRRLRVWRVLGQLLFRRHRYRRRNHNHTIKPSLPFCSFLYGKVSRSFPKNTRPPSHLNSHSFRRLCKSCGTRFLLRKGNSRCLGWCSRLPAKKKVRNTLIFCIEACLKKLIEIDVFFFQILKTRISPRQHWDTRTLLRPLRILWHI